MQTGLETILSQLVSIPSVSNNSAACHEIIEFVRNDIQPLNLFVTSDTDRENPWLIATTQDTKEPDIMLVAHLDVVPAETEAFTVVNQDGKLYGRGVYDMKLAVACYLTLFKRHIDELRSLNVGLMFTTDEEVNSASVPPIFEAGWRPKLAFIPDGGDNWHVEECAKGLYGIEIIARGQTAHGSRPWEGDNALHRLMDVLTILRERFPHQHPDSSTLAVNHITGGNAINQIADYAAAKVDFRSFSKEDIRLFFTKQYARFLDIFSQWQLMHAEKHHVPARHSLVTPAHGNFRLQHKHLQGCVYHHQLTNQKRHNIVAHQRLYKPI